MSLLIALLLTLTDGPTIAYRIPSDVPRIEIDGRDTDAVWATHPHRKRHAFQQVRPDYGKPSPNDTEYAIAYDDRSVYVFMRMYDEQPHLIPRQLTPRDVFSESADVAAISIDTYGKAQAGYAFFVTSAGTQIDELFVGTNTRDRSWNAVWESAVAFDEQGWTVEIRIPLAAIRFPAMPEQPWRFIVYRVTKRLNEEATSVPFDATIQGILHQMAPLEGVRDIRPPLRLELYPYASVGVNETGGTRTFNWNFGTDLRYGINEAFTLDMTLVPDFSHVKSDEQVLNLSVFDVRFQENRPFFTEGTELFNRYDLFYSRRIGQAYAGSEPTPLLNAFKVTGRTNGGTGIGVLNAVTQPTGSGDPWMNFNAVTVDQAFGKRNSLALTNTNVWRGEGLRKANVSMLRTDLYDRTDTWGLEAAGIVSHVTDNTASGTGFRGNLEAGKIRGAIRYEYEADFVTRDYSVRDFGFQQATNYLEQEFNLMYVDLDGNRRFQTKEAWLETQVRHQADPFVPERLAIEIGGSGRTRAGNLNFFGWIWSTPFGQHDFYDARHEGAVLYRPVFHMTGFGMRTDPRKAVQVVFENRYGHAPEWKQHVLEPMTRLTVRFSDRLSGSYQLNATLNRNQRGGFNGNGVGGEILIGRREVRTLTQRASVQVTPDVRQSLNLSLYRIRTDVEYDRYYALGTNRRLRPTATLPATDPSRKFRYLALDANYQIQFAPGSFVNLNAKTIREQDPESASVSVKVIWYWSAR